VIHKREQRRAQKHSCLKTVNSAIKTDRTCSEALSAAQHDKKRSTDKNRTTPHPPAVLDRRNFSVLFFYKPTRQPAPIMAALR